MGIHLHLSDHLFSIWISIHTLFVEALMLHQYVELLSKLINQGKWKGPRTTTTGKSDLAFSLVQIQSSIPSKHWAENQNVLGIHEWIWFVTTIWVSITYFLYLVLITFRKSRLTGWPSFNYRTKAKLTKSIIRQNLVATWMIQVEVLERNYKSYCLDLNPDLSVTIIIGNRIR